MLTLTPVNLQGVPSGFTRETRNQLITALENKHGGERRCIANCLSCTEARHVGVINFSHLFFQDGFI